MERPVDIYVGTLIHNGVNVATKTRWKTDIKFRLMSQVNIQSTFFVVSYLLNVSLM